MVSGSDPPATPPLPTHIAMFVAMPVPPAERDAREPNDSPEENGLQGLCFEIGVTEVKK